MENNGNIRKNSKKAAKGPNQRLRQRTAVLIILITHIIIAVLWMLIKILSALINGQRSHKVIVPGGCYLDVNIIRKIDRKIKISA